MKSENLCKEHANKECYINFVVYTNLLLQINENEAFENHLSNHSTPEFPRRNSCQLGFTSSSLDDINNDNFQELHIDEEDLSQSMGSLSDVLDNVQIV